MECDREGTFKADIIEYGLKEHESGAVSLNIQCALGELWDRDNKVWDEWAQHDMRAFGSLNLVKKDGTLNQTQIKSLVEATGWNGDFAAIANCTWQPLRCQVQTKRNEYEGNVSFRVNWVNPVDAEPGSGLSNIDPDKAKALNARFGGNIRALAGNATRNATPAAGKPPAPKANGTRKPAQAAVDANAAFQEAAAGEDDIPF